MGFTMNAATRPAEELPAAPRHGDDGALAVLVERHRDRLERMVRLRMDRRLQGRVDAADGGQGAYLALRGKFPQYCADSRPPLFLWLGPGGGQKLGDGHRFPPRIKKGDAGQEGSA